MSTNVRKPYSLRTIADSILQKCCLMYTGLSLQAVKTRPDRSTLLGQCQGACLLLCHRHVSALGIAGLFVYGPVCSSFVLHSTVRPGKVPSEHSLWSRHCNFYSHNAAEWSLDQSIVRSRPNWTSSWHLLHYISCTVGARKLVGLKGGSQIPEAWQVRKGKNHP